MTSTWIKDLIVRPETTKLLEENIGTVSPDISLGDDFSDLMPKASSTKTKINKWDYIQMKTYSQQKKPWRKWKCNLTSGRKYLEIMLSVKGLISKIYKELIEQVNSIANNRQSNLKTGRESEHFSTKAYRWSTSPWKDASLIIRKMQIKTAQGITSYLSEWLLSKKTKKEQVLVGMWISASHYGKQYGGFSKMNDRTTVLYSHSTSGYLSKGNENTKLKRYMHLHVYWVWYAKFKMWKQC